MCYLFFHTKFLQGLKIDVDVKRANTVRNNWLIYLLDIASKFSMEIRKTKIINF